MNHSFSRVGVLTLALAVLFFGVVTAALAVPTNDNFVNRGTVPLTDTVETTTVVSGATLEASEAVGSCEPVGSPTDWSLWYQFDATASGTVKITTRLTPTPNGTNYITVYELGPTPTASNPGAEVACSAGANVNNWEGTVTSGESYAVQVTGRAQDNATDTVAITYSTTGTLSGAVTEAGTGNPRGGITVSALNTFGTDLQAYDTTAADGIWSMTVPVGDVIVQFVDGTGVYATQYYDGAATSNAADVLTVTTGSSLSGIDAALNGAGTLKGTITDTDGGPIENALVTIYDSPNPGSPVKLGLTDSNGDYSLELLPAGNYLMKFSAPGYFTEWFDEQPDFSTATTVQLQAGQTRVFDEDLAGEGSINGVITDDLGDAVQGAVVKIYPTTANPGDAPVATGLSNNIGVYLSDNPLPPGDYKVFADTEQALDGRYGAQWWDGKASLGASDTVTLGPGETFLADFTLDRSVVSGTVTSDADDLPLEDVTVTLKDFNDYQIGQVLTDSFGDYEFVKIPTVNSPLTISFDGTAAAHGTGGIFGPFQAGNQVTANIRLTPTPKAPVIGVGGLSVSVAENVSVGTTVTTLTATDENRADTLSWSITGGNTGGAFVIDASSGVITTAGGLDYEFTPSYSLTVEVSDGSESDTETVAVTVTDVNEAPVIGAGGLSVSVAENVAVGTEVTTLTATDVDAGDTLTWSITGGNTGGAFAIDASSGVIETVETLDFETTSSYVLTVQVSDGGLSDSAQVQVTVTDVDETPLVTGPNVERLFGSNRYRTGVAVSEARFAGTSDVVFIATGANFPDALVAAAPAGDLDAPVLLVAQNSVDVSVMAELQRLSPSKIYVVGGSAVISDAVVSTLGSVAPVTRLFGSNRYSTAVDVSKEFYTSTSSVFIATGSSFPDALVGAAPAGRDGSPILLVPKDSVPSNVLAELSRLAPSRIYVLGGTAVVSSSVESTLSGIAAVTRLAGSNRFGTADAVASALFPTAGGADSAYLATAYNFPDALVAAAAAGKEGGPVLLTATDTLTGYADQQIRRLKPADVFIIGGTAVVSDTVMNAVDW